MCIDHRVSMVPMILSPSERTVRKAERAWPPTSRAGRHNAACGEGGFTLLEIVCVLAIIALLAAVLLPRIADGTSRPRLEAYALEAASVLKADRSAAIRRRVEVVSDLNPPPPSLRSAPPPRTSRLPHPP